MRKNRISRTAAGLLASTLVVGALLPMAGCAGGSGPKYYDIVNFANADGKAQIQQLREQGFGYFDQEGGWAWGGTPDESLASGPAWLVFHGVETDELGWNVLSREQVSENAEIEWVDLSWSDLEYSDGDLGSAVRQIAEKCGLKDATNEGWTPGDYSYCMVGKCTLEGKDAYWVVEATPASTSEDSSESATASVRIAVYQLGEDSYDYIVSSIFPAEEQAGSEDGADTADVAEVPEASASEETAEGGEEGAVEGGAAEGATADSAAAE